ncbi:putative membrane protein [Dyella sp. SG562]|uniref:TPM domain-containing protein n=1 Tax=Dyella sp. SG562 TaxID=2587017 RepID=UPI001424934B|nr:TPM domain-containing protein [Dyella sp. SG562]NII71639.1 putative membrane protein [Dyella sp. SG562]
MGRAQRFFANLGGAWFLLRRAFAPAVLDEMTRAIADGERRHKGEVCFAVEARLSPWDVLEGLDARRRAEQVFAQLRVWDTEHNCGVLFYVLLAEHRIEIVADRGIAAAVPQAEWDAICARMRECFARGEWREGSLGGIGAAHELLARHFPGDGAGRPDELPDRPVLL